MNIDDKLKQYKPLVRATIRRKFPGLITDEDIFQIGFIALWKAMIQFKKEKGASFETYASQVIKNEIINELKKRGCEKRSGCKVISLCEPIPSSEGLTVEDSLKDAEDIESFRDAKDFITALNGLERKMVNNKSKGMTDEEIASVVNLSRQSVSKRLQNLKQRMRNDCL